MPHTLTRGLTTEIDAVATATSEAAVGLGQCGRKLRWRWPRRAGCEPALDDQLSVKSDDRCRWPCGRVAVDLANSFVDLIRYGSYLGLRRGIERSVDRVFTLGPDGDRGGR
jgi:hypothetical protein